MDLFVVAQFAFATLLPVVATVLLTLARRSFASIVPESGWQFCVGVVFGLIAIFGTEAGIPVNGAMMNVRDAAPLAAGLFFGGPAGIIAGLIGGIERFCAVLWGVGEFTQVACSLGTIFAGVYAALLRKLLFDNRIPSWSMAIVSGVVAEVVHLLLVFVTNFDEEARAFEVVKLCTLPMVSCVALSTLLSAIAVALINKQPLLVPRSKRGIAQIVQSRLLIGVVVAFVITIGFTAALQANLSQTNTESLLKLNIEDAENDIVDDISAQEQAVVKSRRVGQDGALVVIDETGKVVSTRAELAGTPTDQLATDTAAAEPNQVFSTTLDGEKYFASYNEVEGYRIIALISEAEANFSRDVSVLIMSFMEVLVFATLFLIIYFAIKRIVVRSIWQVNGRLSQITRGDLGVEVDVRETSEFASLSDDINRTVAALKESIAAVQSDLDMAADIQANTLPTLTPAIEEHGEFELRASMEPAKEVGGDFYDFFMVDDDHIALVVADVSGKGVPAALFMMLSKTVIKMEALSGLSPAEVLLRANADLSEKNDDDMFTTAWLGLLEISTGKLVYADAGHEKLAIYHDGAWELPRKPNGAVALASFDQADYMELKEKYHFRDEVLQLQPGDAIFQYTDGVTEATDAEDDLFGEERLIEALNGAESQAPEAILPAVREQIAGFVKDAPQFDDITMLGLMYKG